MKNLKLLLFGMVFLFAVSLTYALPEISYTNFARGAGGNLVLSGTVNVEITILDGSTQSYQEIHTNVPTNEFGLFTVDLGAGTPVGLDTYNGILAKSSLNIRSRTDDGGGYRFIELSALLTTALKNEEAAAAVSLNDAYITGNEIDVVAGLPVDLKGTGLIQSAASVADINANGNSTLTTKKYVDDAVAAILPLDPLTVNEGLQMTPGPSYDGTAAQVVGIAPKAITNAKIADATEFLAVAALGNGGVNGADAGTVSLTNLTHTLNFRGVGNTNVTRTGSTILIDGADNWGSQVVMHDETLVGNGTTGNLLGVDFEAPLYLSAANKLGVNIDPTLEVVGGKLAVDLDKNNSWNGNQLLPATLAQGDNLITAIEAGTPYTMDIDVLAKGTAGQVLTSTSVASTWANLNDADASDIDFFANIDVAALDLQIKNGKVGNTEINDATVFVEVTGNGTPFDVTDGNPVLNFTGNSITSVTLDDATNTVHIESAVATEAPITGDGTLGNAIGLDYDATLELNAGKLGIDLDHKNTWTVTQRFQPAVNEPGIILNGTNLTNAPVLYANGFSSFYNEKTGTNTAFAVQGHAKGQLPSVGNPFPAVAQGLTGVAEYSGTFDPMAPTMIIGSASITYPGTGVIAIGTYGGSREENAWANVGTVGHAVNDAAGPYDMNHGILGLISNGAVPAGEIFALLGANLNSAVTGVNMGIAANDFAGYFMGKVKSTGTIEGTLLIGALSKKIEEGAGIANFMFNNSADAIVALDYNYANEWFVTQTFSDIVVNGNTLTGSLDVDTDAMVGGDVTAGGMFIGALENPLVSGDGIETFSYNNNAGQVVALDHSFANHWLAKQTFDDIEILGGTIDGALIGSIDAEDGTFVNLTADDLTVNIDATVGGNLDVTGDITGNNITAGGIFSGDLEFGITNGDGVATFSFNNSGDAVVAFDYGFSNSWTVLQSFTDINVSVNTETGSLDVNNDATVGGSLTVANLTETDYLDVLSDATVGGNLEVGNNVIANNLFIGDLEFGITNGDGIAAFSFNNSGDAVVAFDYGFSNSWTVLQSFTDINVSVNTTTGSLDVNNDANVGGSLSVANLTETDYLDVLSDATVGGNLGVGGDVTATTFIGSLQHNIANGDGIAAFTFDNSGDAVVAFDYAFENNWTAPQSFVNLDYTGTLTTPLTPMAVPFIGATGELTEDAANFFVNGTDLNLAGTMYIGTDLDVAGDGVFGGNVTATTFIGALEYNISEGAGIAGFTFDNTGDAVVALDYTYENDWTAPQSFVDLDYTGTLTTPLAPTGIAFIGAAGDLTVDEINLSFDGTDLFVNNTVYAGAINGGFSDMNMLFADATGNIVEDTDGDFYYDHVGGDILYVPNVDVDDVVVNNDLVVTNSITVNNYKLPLADGTVGQFVVTDGAGNLDWAGINGTLEYDIAGDLGLKLDNSNTWDAEQYLPDTEDQGNNLIAAINEATDAAIFQGLTGTTQTPLAIHDDLNGDLFITKNYLDDYLFNADELSFSGLVLFNAGSGPAIEATSSDASSPTVTIENTNLQGVALELVGAAPQTTALEISTGGLNIANGQLIVSSNSGVSGGDPNGPTITVNNNGDGGTENGGAIQIVMGHTAFSYNNFTPANNADVDASKEPHSILDVVSNGTNKVTLPNGDVAANNLGTIIYVINSGSGTLQLYKGLTLIGTVAAGQSAQLVYTANSWFILN